ncbi:MAG: RdgB/HAM1 family non-canonical purine NTP pyrophosphatase [Cyclobacteriaceae bacterium]|nr:RdgB/HAM1 family non-canonical purine NTP pyrophosphatase [Cyclobacteriaceae bacterium]MDW8331266.1 RdgB/HAM1 family non-canonical purine NTP pyrophosphatase [Cyclobacteriaceae bacterium]
MPASWVFATNNLHKLEEVKQAAGNQIIIQSLAEIGCTEDLPETGETLQDNARQKAEFVFQRFGVACFADDSGLEVEALGGEPGVHSAHYAGPQRSSVDNIHLLLARMEGKKNRKARFRCVIALVEKDEVQLFEGMLPGEIIQTPRGTGGFGYDPVFVPEGETRTLAEMSLEEKNRISHRAKAMRKLIGHLLSRQPSKQSL